MGAIKAHLETLSVILGEGGAVTDNTTQFGLDLWELVEGYGFKLTVENTLITSFYECECGERWESQWSCACNDQCGECGTKDIEPYEWKVDQPAQVIVEAEQDLTLPQVAEFRALRDRHVGLHMEVAGNKLIFVEDAVDTSEEIAAEENRRDHKRGLYGDT